MPVRTRLGNLSTVAELRPVDDVEHVDHRRHVETVGHAERDRLGRRRQRGGRQEVVEQLHRLALAGVLADVEDVAGERRRGACGGRRARRSGPANISEIVAARAPGDAARDRPVDSR